jgi:hypothetical protein
MDGFETETHFLRGHGSYARIAHSLKNLIDVGLHVAVAVCIHQGNKVELFRFLNGLHQCGVTRVKLQLWRAQGATVHDIFPLSSEEMVQILEQAAHVNHTLCAEFIQIPSYEYNARDRSFIKRRAKYPDIVVGFDGYVRWGELGESICAIEDNILDAYARFVRDKKADFLVTMEKSLQESYDFSIMDVDRSVIQASALIFENAGKKTLLMDKAIQGLTRTFLIFHECAHLVQGTIHTDPRQCVSESEERSANLWALEAMSPYLMSTFVDHAKELALENEDQLFTYICTHGEQALVGLWEDDTYDRNSSTRIVHRAAA